MRVRLAALVALGALPGAGCSSREHPVPASAATISAHVDSIVLERTACYGTCPRYRLRVTGDGVVTFVSNNRGEDVTASDSVPRSVVDTLYAHVVRSAFFALPDTIVEGTPLCAEYATDHSSIILGVFGPQRKRVVYDTGCGLSVEHEIAQPALASLHVLAAEIDTVTNARRWIRPSRRR